MPLGAAEALASAYQAGRYAHANARGLDACPLYAMGEEGARWRKEWQRGWHDADRESGYLRTRSATKKPEAGKPIPVRTGGRRRR